MDFAFAFAFAFPFSLAAAAVAATLGLGLALELLDEKLELRVLAAVGGVVLSFAAANAEADADARRNLDPAVRVNGVSSSSLGYDPTRIKLYWGRR